ncbi:hypothetical protein F9L07_06795 [Pimelobacter simplex]|uniref:DUF5666 domain-containing protein n=1 Tax=Nocardioides simplex TaxID=2045 RepID=A0A7J5DZZ3_NOCSI|nr:DUF5666 domain-containing protein [Pimelobacter simplex]KAB2811570.1 hypothetical protein F9L07_06795 [Pimelobacter simplex]
MTSIPIRTDRPLALLATGTFMALVLAGCGSDDAAAPDSTAAAAGPAAGSGAPGTSGQIAAVDGKVLQVRSQRTGQVAVTVTDRTTVTDQVAGTYADVTVGSCVVVRTGTGDGAAAMSVAVQAAGDDGCSGPGGGQRPTDLPSDLPSDLPTDRPTDRPSGMPGFGVRGEVTSVADGSFVVSGGPDGDRTVTVADTTTYTHAAAATAAALTKGRCVQVSGDPDDTGAVTATAIQVSDAVDDQCGR